MDWEADVRFQRERRKPATQSHDFVVKVVSISLGFVAVGGMAGIIFLTYFERAIDAAVATMVGGAIGALGTLLSNVRSAIQEPQQTATTQTGDITQETPKEDTT